MSTYSYYIKMSDNYTYMERLIIIIIKKLNKTKKVKVMSVLVDL